MAHRELDERKSAILSQIIEEHVASARAVGSKMIVDKYDWEVSPATVRAEMSEIEDGGYVTHHHTSAGRLPTEKGYQWYVSSLNIHECSVSSRLNERLQRTKQESLSADKQFQVKQIAKEIANIASAAVVVGFEKHNAYYTGLSLLFSHPEFGDVEVVRSFSEMLDQMDEALQEAFESAQGGTMVSIGRENPFGSECSFVATKVMNYLFGILGPMRMDYKKNIGLVNWVRENI